MLATLPGRCEPKVLAEILTRLSRREPIRSAVRDLCTMPKKDGGFGRARLYAQMGTFMRISRLTAEMCIHWFCAHKDRQCLG